MDTFLILLGCIYKRPGFFFACFFVVVLVFCFGCLFCFSPKKQREKRNTSSVYSRRDETHNDVLEGSFWIP